MNYEHRKKGYASPAGKPAGSKVAILGMGSAGFGCAEILAQKGYEITIFESKSAKNLWREKLEEFEHIGVKLVLSNDIGKNKTIDSLFKEDFDAVFIDIDSGIDTEMKDVAGKDLSGVYKSTDFLAYVNKEARRLSDNLRTPLEIGRRVVVIGCDDKTPECLHAVMKLGSEDVTCLCRQSEDELPVERNEQAMVRVEGAKYRFLTQPVRFIAGSDGRLAAVECIELKHGEPDAQGHIDLIPVEGSTFSVAADTAILSNNAGSILREGVFTSVDYEASHAAGGRTAAFAIDEYLKSKK